MRTLPWLFLLASLCPALSGTAAEDDPAVLAQKVADTEGLLPWFWTPLMEDAGHIPFTFEMRESRQTTDRSGKVLHPPTTLQMERIPLAGGSYYRCLMQNGTSPCSDAIVQALELDAKKAETFTDDEKAKAKAAGDERRLRRRAFWTDFPKAFRFQQTGPGEISFVPTGKYKPQRDPDTSLLAKIKGAFHFDPRTFEITQLQYEMLADSEIISRLYKGTTYSVTLSDLADHHYVPVKQSVRRILPKGGIEIAESEYLNYRRFATDSSVQFVDKDKDEH